MSQSHSVLTGQEMEPFCSRHPTDCNCTELEQIQQQY